MNEGRPNLPSNGTGPSWRVLSVMLFLLAAFGSLGFAAGIEGADLRLMLATGLPTFLAFVLAIWTWRQ